MSARRRTSESRVLLRARVLRGRWAWLGLALILLPGCFLGREREAARELFLEGHRLEAHAMLQQLAVDYEDPRASEMCREVARHVASDFFERAQLWLARGFPEQAYDELSRCLLFDPEHVLARSLAMELGEEHTRLLRWEDEFCRAIDEERWDDALARVEGPPLRHFRWTLLGRIEDLLRSSWDERRALHEQASAASDLEALGKAIGNAEEWLRSYGELAQEADPGFAEAVQEELEGWRQRASVKRQISELRGHADSSVSFASLQILSRALCLDPESEALRAECLRMRDTLIQKYHAELRQHMEREQWSAALRIAKRLEKLGGRVDRELASGLPSLEQLRALELMSEAKEEEEDGRPANALLLLIEAQQLNADQTSVVHEVARLRSELVARPLVSIDPEVKEPPCVDTVIVHRRSPVYDEHRRSLLTRRSKNARPSGFMYESNPAYRAEQQRWLRARDEVQQLYEAWQSTSDIDRACAKARYEASAELLEQSRRRLQQMAARLERTAWELEDSAVETRELVAEMRVPVQIYREDKGWIQHQVTETVRVTDRMSKKGGGLPGDPDELPSEQVARQRLEAECEGQLAELMRSLREEARRSMLERARFALQGDEANLGIQLAVKVALTALERPDPLRLEAVRLLSQAGAAPRRVAESL